jgi:hypothetical protein
LQLILQNQYDCHEKKTSFNAIGLRCNQSSALAQALEAGI